MAQIFGIVTKAIAVDFVRRQPTLEVDKIVLPEFRIELQQKIGRRAAKLCSLHLAMRIFAAKAPAPNPPRCTNVQKHFNELKRSNDKIQQYK